MVTGFYGGLLGIIYFFLTITVIRGRRKTKTSYGMGKEGVLSNKVSAHANFAAYIPFMLILLLIVELQKPHWEWFLHIAGIIFTLGRVFHAYGLIYREPQNDFRFRVYGMMCTINMIVVLTCVNFYLYLSRFLSL